jgi:uncharacterized OB-fold protein
MTDVYATTAATAPTPNSTYKKPLPRLDAWNRHFWEKTRDRVLVAQRDEEGLVWFPPSPLSPFTRSDCWSWSELSGRGTVASWVVFHQSYFAGFAEESPYNVALVQLEEGPRIFTNLVAVSLDAIRIGMPVELAFREMNGEMALPVFQPAGAAA